MCAELEFQKHYMLSHLRLKDSNVLLNFHTIDTPGIGEDMCSQETPTHLSLSELAVLTRTREKVVQGIDISISKNFFYFSWLIYPFLSHTYQISYFLLFL